MVRNNRSVIKISKTKLETILDLLTILSFSVFLIYFFFEWFSLPNRTPVHFNMSGEPDRWGEKWVFWIPIIIGILLWVGFSKLEKHPHTYNYIYLTEENAERQYKNARISLNIIKAEFTILILFLSWMSLQVSKGNKELNLIPIWIIGTTVLITIGFFIYRSIRLK